MADFTQIIQKINDDINTNGVGAITGAKLNEVLRDMIAAVNAKKQDPLTIDATPTEDSTNTVQSGGVFDALLGKATRFYTPDITDIPPTILNRLKVGDIVSYGNDAMTSATVAVIDEQNAIIILVYNDGMNVVGFQYQNGICTDTVSFSLSDMANKVSGATNGNLAGLDSDGNLTDSGIAASDVATASDLAGKQDTISDLAAIRSGAAAGATAYQKPSGGIPKTDLASGVQTSLGKADTAVQQVTVGTTTTVNAGTNASVTNSGTSTAPVLDFTIPRGADGADGQDGADAVNPFKGWWPDLATLKAAHTATAGDSAYVKDASPATTWSIYVYDSTASSDNYWADSGTDADTSNVQTFASGEEVNLTGITSHISIASKKLIESGAIYTAFNTLVQLLRKVAYVEDDAKDILDVLESLISGLDIPITGITIVGDASVVGSAVYVATLEPSDTTERDIVWSITSGSEYATVLPNGTLVVLNNGNIVLKCESAINSSVYDTKTIAVTDSATHIMPLTSDTDDTVGSLTPTKSAYTAISSDGMQITSNSNEGLSYAYSADFKTFIFDLKYAKSATIWQYIFGNWAGGNVSNLGFAIKQNTNDVWYTTDSGDFSANKTLSESTWHRIGVQIISATSASLWIDGEKIVTPNFTSKTITHYIFGNNWRFQAVNGTRAIGGYFKNLKIYDQVLSDDLMTVKTQIS